MNIYLLILSVALGGLVEFLLKYITPKSRFVGWLMHSYEHALPLSDGKIAPVFIKAFRFDNLGKFPVTNIEI